MGLIENIEAETGPLGDAERQSVERELDLLAAFAEGLVGRIPADGTAEQQQATIAELLADDADLAAAFSELMQVSRSNRASPMQSLHRMGQELEDLDGG
jgi:hypothetical protein